MFTTLGIAAGTFLPYTWLGSQFEMTPLPYSYFPYLVCIIFAYMLLATVMKKVFVRKYGELL
jgi:Mg2+-importing ATPase